MSAWNKIKESLKGDFPSFETALAQKQRNLMICAIIIEFIIFIPFAFWTSFNNMEYWNSRLMAYLTIAFIIVTGIFGIIVSHRLDASSKEKDAISKMARNGRVGTLLFVIAYMLVLIVGANV